MQYVLGVIPSIIVGAWAVFVLYWIISSFSVKRDINRPPFWRAPWARIILIAVVITWSANSSRLGRVTQHIGILTPSTYGALAVFGAILCLVGIGFAIWARVHLGRNWSVAPALKEGHELVTSGPYAFVRHPIYTGVLLAALGSTLATPSWLVMLVVISVMFIWRVHVEEALMTKQFPNQYPAYKKRTWALVPYVW